MNKQRVFQIWSEGYATTGVSGPAQYHGSGVGETFQQAVQNFKDNNPEVFTQGEVDSLSIYGCRLFDNEAEARASFG